MQQVVAVIQLINKKDGTEFGEEDEEIMSCFLEIAAPIVYHSQLFQQKKLPGDGQQTEFGASVTATAKAASVPSTLQGMAEEDEEDEEDEENI